MREQCRQRDVSGLLWPRLPPPYPDAGPAYWDGSSLCSENLRGSVVYADSKSRAVGGVCVCVCVCWVGGHVTHIPLRGCMFKPKTLRSRLQNCGLCSQDEDSTQRGPSMNFVD